MREALLRVSILGVLLAACTKPNPNVCHGDSDCTDPARPFCDLNGEYAESGYDPNTCSTTPAGCPAERCGCTPGVMSCSGGELVTCNADGTSQTTTTCAFGCAGDGTRCLTFDPSHGLGPALTAAANEPDIVLPRGSQIDTGTGIVTDAAGNAVPVNSLVVTDGSTSIRVFLGSSRAAGPC